MRNPYSRGKLDEENASGVKRHYWFYVVTRFPLYVFWLGWDAIAGWSASRSGLGKSFLIGLPAFLAVVATATFGYYVVIDREEDLTTRYEVMAGRATYFKSFDSAAICYRRLIHEGEKDPQKIFQAALVAGEIGNEDEKAALLGRLTNDGDYRYGRAHLYKARIFLAEPDGTTISLAKRELERALEVDPSLSEAHALLGELYAQEGEVAKAIESLERGASIPEAAFSLARLHDRADNELERARWARQAAEAFAVREMAAEAGSEGQRHALVLHARALAVGKRYEEALSKLQPLYGEGQDARVNAAIASVCARWSRALLEAEELQDAGEAMIRLVKSVRLLRQAVDLAPAEPTTVAVLAEITGLVDVPWQLSEDDLRTMLSEGKAPWLLHWIAGIRAWKADLGREEKVHLAIALDQNPMTTMLAAWAVRQACEQDHLDVEEGCRLLAGLQSMDQKPAARFAIAEVRGSLLVRKELWSQAIVAYEAALAINEERVDLHWALVHAHEQNGNREAAARHREMAEQLQLKSENE